MFASGNLAPTVGTLENPQPGFQSGIGLISGWVCDAQHVTYQIDGAVKRVLIIGIKRVPK